MEASRGNGGTDEHRAAGREARMLGESVRALEHDTRSLLAAIEQLSASASDALREQMNERPYAALGVGLIAGYVVGGGLSLRLATLLAATAGRATMAQLVARGVGGSWARAGRTS